MQVIYDPHDQNNIDLVAYVDTLTKTGATVKLVENSDRISCSLAAQLQVN